MRRACPRPGLPGAAARGALARLLATALGIALLVSPASAGWWDEAVEARKTTLEEVGTDPGKWRDVPIVLDVLFAREAERVQPFFTQFAPSRWRPIAVHETIEGRPGPEHDRLFVRRAGRDDRRVADVRPGQALRLRAVVRDDVGGTPWIEILSIVLPGDELTPEEEARVVVADRFLARSNAEAAARIYGEILDARDLAPGDRTGLLRKLASAQHESGAPEKARAALRAALELDPDHRPTQARLARLEAALRDRDAAIARPPRTAARTAPGTGKAPETGPTDSETTNPPPVRRTPLRLPGPERPLAPPLGLTDAPDAGTSPTAPKAKSIPRDPAREATARPRPVEKKAESADRPERSEGRPAGQSGRADVPLPARASGDAPPPSSEPDVTKRPKRRPPEPPAPPPVEPEELEDEPPVPPPVLNGPK